ncbi:MAG: NAD-dependent epimerase/dehydratase family protein [Dethiobacter sp.]|jgi:UDP-glucose 4-epimerase|nr:NAD-dependent epimerase/dehydratase family protein [Dethiobacter sp.]MBS3899753.1 NAD-dependent epimerase/dehydratase family protein [Dethiobacter sp.]MBS3982961.1 NAD-dependent epimerase/dehydratase family protein [Dethiobacter sp.]MCL4463641.1 NAD-dependent epimerase/dehydratase family protein [Bacillota bacterium]MCL5993472.1 NAD-dependent epimerase/dehydratase family protein [Bacillota bacterium]
MHYLITGGAGFIGTHLTKRLLEKGQQVSILDNLTTGRAERLTELNANVIVGCVTDRELVSRLVAASDYIIHLACIVGVRLAMHKGIETLKISYLGTENLLEAATLHQKEIFIASSSAIYGKISQLSVTEKDDSLLGASSKASWLYSVGKLVEEHLSLAYFRERGTKIKIGRFFNVIGCYQTDSYGMVVPNFVRQALKGSPLTVYEDGSQTRTFGYIEDILDGVELITASGAHGQIYNLGGFEEISILELALKIKSLTSSASPIEFIPYAAAFGSNFEETRKRVPNISRLRQLGYSPRYSLDNALREIIAHHTLCKN